MRVLIACEFSGHVRDAFLALGHEAYSVDILDPPHSPLPLPKRSPPKSHRWRRPRAHQLPPSSSLRPHDRPPSLHLSHSRQISPPLNLSARDPRRPLLRPPASRRTHLSHLRREPSRPPHLPAPSAEPHLDLRTLRRLLLQAILLLDQESPAPRPADPSSPDRTLRRLLSSSLSSPPVSPLHHTNSSRRGVRSSVRTSTSLVNALISR